MGMTITQAIGEDADKCVEIMLEDGHGVPNVTHLVSFDGEPMGCFSIAPALFFYMRPVKVSALQSYKAFHAALNMIQDRNVIPVVSIETKSPYRPFLPKMGFERLNGAETHILCATSK